MGDYPSQLTACQRQLDGEAGCESGPQSVYRDRVLGRDLGFASDVVGAVAALPDGPSSPKRRTGSRISRRPRRGRPTASRILSGIWRVARGFGAPGLAGVGGAAGAPLLDGTIPPRANQFWDIGCGLEGGLPLQPWAAELLKKRIADNGKDNPDAHCLPMGNMQLHNHPQPRKIIQTPDLIVILYEGNAGIRQIFMDGRPLPEQRPAAVVVWLLDGKVGRRHAGGPDHRFQGRRVARHQRQPVDRCRESGPSGSGA